MDARPPRDSHRHILPSLDQIDEFLSEPAMESDCPVPAQDMARRSDRNIGSPNLAERNLVPIAPANGSGATSRPVLQRHRSSLTKNAMATQKPDLETRRIQSLKRKYQDTGLNDESLNLFMETGLDNTPTNRLYQRGQHLFITWELQQNVSFTEFLAQDLVNSLVYLHSQGYGSGTIKTNRTAALKLHVQPSRLRYHEDIHVLFSRPAGKAPPIAQTKLHFDLTPTLQQLVQVPSSKETDHPAAKNQAKEALFVKGNQPTCTVKMETISSWLRALVCFSTSHTVLVRSLASSLALERGMPINEIVTLGNWSSEEVFQNHYRQNHTSEADFTNLVLQTPPLAVRMDKQEEDNEEYFDTRDMTENRLCISICSFPVSLTVSSQFWERAKFGLDL
ncbi:hypothetical protein CLU79DRAFT_830785 [Phycomyces nitens]|nr:hypothetical protein CLU79DRAFT_830785 [Phycomyces nitens]